jgi:hypothetical protein
VVTHEAEDVGETVIIGAANHAADLIENLQIVAPSVNDVTKEDDDGLATTHPLDKRLEQIVTGMEVTDSDDVSRLNWFKVR